MSLTAIDEAVCPYCIRGMITIACADGEPTELSRQTIAAALRILPASGLAAVDPISPEELARRIGAPEPRLAAIELMLVIALVAGPTPAKAAQLEAFSRALSVDEPNVQLVADLAAGRASKARRDFRRRYLSNNGVRPGLPAIVTLLRIAAGQTYEPDVAARYEGLAEYSDDQLGKHYWRFVTNNGLRFPGQRFSAISEQNIYHDLRHLLGDYAETPEGEIQVLFFTAGYRTQHAFDYAVFGLLQFHLGLRVSLGAPPARDAFLAEEAMSAWARGARMTEDLAVRKDWWPLFALPVSTVRDRLGIS